SPRRWPRTAARTSPGSRCRGASSSSTRCPATPTGSSTSGSCGSSGPPELARDGRCPVARGGRRAARHHDGAAGLRAGRRRPRLGPRAPLLPPGRRRRPRRLPGGRGGLRRPLRPSGEGMGPDRPLRVRTPHRAGRRGGDRRGEGRRPPRVGDGGPGDRCSVPRSVRVPGRRLAHRPAPGGRRLGDDRTGRPAHLGARGGLRPGPGGPRVTAGGPVGPGGRWSIVGRFLDHVEADPDRLAIDADDRAVSYEELAAGVRAAVAWLEALGVARGDRVAYLGRNRIEFFELLLASAWTGALIVPVNWRLAPGEVEHV